MTNAIAAIPTSASALCVGLPIASASSAATSQSRAAPSRSPSPKSRAARVPWTLSRVQAARSPSSMSASVASRRRAASSHSPAPMVAQASRTVYQASRPWSPWRRTSSPARAKWLLLSRGVIWRGLRQGCGGRGPRPGRLGTRLRDEPPRGAWGAPPPCETGRRRTCPASSAGSRERVPALRWSLPAAARAPRRWPGHPPRTRPAGRDRGTDPRGPGESASAGPWSAVPRARPASRRAPARAARIRTARLRAAPGRMQRSLRSQGERRGTGALQELDRTLVPA